MRNIKFFEDSLLIDEKILVFGDLHLGYEDYIHEGLAQRLNLKEIKLKLEGIFRDIGKKKIERIIILGDVKHDFKGISDNEWREVIDLIDYLNKNTNEIIVIRGNHDNFLKPILKKRNVKLVDYYKLEDILFLHGDKPYKSTFKPKIIIFGHLHPSIILTDGYKKEKFKCFLTGKVEKSKVFILPSFNSLSAGYSLNNITNILDNFSFISNKELKKLKVIIYNPYEKKSYDFGYLKKLI